MKDMNSILEKQRIPPLLKGCSECSGNIDHYKIAGDLLKYAVAAFQAAGKKRASLSVEVDTPTGALCLYERARMHHQREFKMYEKQLRPGKELAVESLS